MNLSYRRLDNESDEELIFRICEDKDKIGTWVDVATIINELTGNDYGESTYRKKYQSFQKILQANQSKFADSDLQIERLNEAREELQKERYKLFDYRNEYNKLLRQRSRQEELNEIIINCLQNERLRPLSPNYQMSGIGCNDSTMMISLNDIHAGAVINNAFNIYNIDVLMERFEQYLEKIRNIQDIHKCSECVIWCNGDMISGSIHRTIAVSNKENVIKQVMVASEYISEFLAELSSMFGEVRFASVAGNHSRLDSKNDSLKDERLDDLIEWYAMARLQNFSNIAFDNYDKIDSTMYLIDIQGKNYVGVHGDYDESDSKIQALQMMIDKKIYAVLLGHKHRNQIGNSQGIKTIMAGSFQGVDDFCIQKRIFGKPEQLVTIVDDNGIICHYDIQFS